MIVYQMTEPEFQAMLNAMKLEEISFPDQWAITDDQKRAQREAAEAVHRRFVYLIHKHLKG